MSLITTLIIIKNLLHIALGKLTYWKFNCYYCPQRLNCIIWQRSSWTRASYSILLLPVYSNFKTALALMIMMEIWSIDFAQNSCCFSPTMNTTGKKPNLIRKRLRKKVFALDTFIATNLDILQLLKYPPKATHFLETDWSQWTRPTLHKWSNSPGAMSRIYKSLK